MYHLQFSTGNMEPTGQWIYGAIMISTLWIALFVFFNITTIGPSFKFLSTIFPYSFTFLFVVYIHSVNLWTSKGQHFLNKLFVVDYCPSVIVCMVVKIENNVVRPIIDLRKKMLLLCQGRKCHKLWTGFSNALFYWKILYCRFKPNYKTLEWLRLKQTVYILDHMQ